MRKFNLELHPKKTRLPEFGPFAGLKPETFNFLGFTQICGKKRSNGRFTVLRQTIRKRALQLLIVAFSPFGPNLVIVDCEPQPADQYPPTT
jgi:hypothetical protein